MFHTEYRNNVIATGQSTIQLDDIDYCESQNLTVLGGFLMIFKNQRRITMSARLTDEEKARGRAHLLDYLNKVAEEPAAMYLWVCNEEDRPS